MKMDVDSHLGVPYAAQRQVAGQRHGGGVRNNPWLVPPWGARESPTHPLRGQDHDVLVELSGFVIDGGQSITDSAVLRKERKGDHGQ